jgi:Rieske Fe-S protein
MFTAKGRVVNNDNIPIKGAKISFEYQTNPLVSYTDGEGIFKFEVNNVNRKGTVSANIKVEAEGYKPYNRYTDFSITNNIIEEIRLQKLGDTDTPVPTAIQVAKIGAAATITAALIAAYVTYRNNINSPSPSPSSPIAFTIRDSLGQYQKSEKVVVSLQGKPVGRLEVNESNLQDEITVNLPHSGTYSYAAEGTTVFQNEKTILSSGSGEIDVAEGKTYQIKFSTDQSRFIVRLEEVH